MWVDEIERAFRMSPGSQIIRRDRRVDALVSQTHNAEINREVSSLVN